MSTSRDSCCLPSVKKQKHDLQVFAFVQCIIKQLLYLVFVISRMIKVEVRVIAKTSSNSCLKSNNCLKSVIA